MLEVKCRSENKVLSASELMVIEAGSVPDQHHSKDATPDLMRRDLGASGQGNVILFENGEHPALLQAFSW